MPEESITTLEERRARLCRELATIGGMRSGSLTARCRRCGKTGCGCAPPGEAQRGPVLSLTRAADSAAATRTAGSGEPPTPPDGALTNPTCAPLPDG